MLDSSVESTPGVGEAADELDIGGVAHGVIALVTITLQVAGETVEQARRDAAATGGVIVERDNRSGGLQKFDCADGGFVIEVSRYQNGPFDIADGDFSAHHYKRCREADVFLDGTQIWYHLDVAARKSALVANNYLYAEARKQAFVLDGRYTFTVDITNPRDDSGVVTFYGKSITKTTPSDEWHFKDFDYVYTYDGNTGTSTLTEDYTLYSQALGGSATIDTTEAFVFVDGTGLRPQSGALTVTGKGGTRITLQVVDATQVFLEYDLDGDGIAERSVAKTWQELRASAAWDELYCFLPMLQC